MRKSTTKPSNGHRTRVHHVAANVRTGAVVTEPAIPILFYGEIRTRAGKVKYRTRYGYDTREDAAAEAFKNGPDWARECVTYAGLETHTR